VLVVLRVLEYCPGGIVRIGGLMNFRTIPKIALALLALCSLSALAQEPARGRGGARQAPAPPTLVFKETWKAGAMTSLTQDAVANPDLQVVQYGPGNQDDFGVTNEGGVNHIWTGLCNSACAVTLKHKDNYVDLSGKARIRWYTKTSGFHEIRPVLKLADGTYLIGDHVDAGTFDYKESEFYVTEVKWLRAEMPKVLTKGNLLDKVDLSKVDEVGFADLTPGSGHGNGGYSDVAWIEVYGKAVKRDAQ